MTALMRRPRSLLVPLGAALVAAAVAFPSVLASAAPHDASAAAAKPKADWTLMIYAVADTHAIANDIVVNLATFAKLPVMKNVNLVVEVDLPEKNEPGYPTATIPGIAPFSDTKLIVLNGAKYDEVRDLGEVAMGRPDSLATFIAEAAGRFPAKKYGLVLSDHGGAYQGGYVDDGPPGTTQLSIAGMRDGINAGLQAAGIKRLDVLDHDSCLMSNYEVASGLSSLATSMAGSEESIFGDETITPQAIQVLARNGTGQEFGEANTDAYAKQVDEGAPELAPFTAMSVIDGDKMKIFNAAMESFTKVAVAQMSTIAPEIAKARAQSLQFVKGLDAAIGEDNSDPWDLVDLGDFLRHLDNLPASVEVARNAALAALDGAVVHQDTRQATQQATGLSVYLPDNPQYLKQYVAQSAPPGWGKFLTAFLTSGVGTGGGGGSAGGGSAAFASTKAEVVSADPSGIKIQAQLASGTENNVVDQQTQVVTQLDGKKALALLLPAYLNAGAAGRVQGTWNYAVTELQQGNKSVPVTASYQAQSGGLLGEFYAKYVAPTGETGDVRVRLLLDSGGQITSVTVTDASSDTSAAGVTLANGGTLTPYLYVVGANGAFTQTLSSQSVTVTDDLAVGYSKLDAGTAFDMALVVKDVAGKLSGAGVSGQVK
ncbi:MAG: hypothetical protein JWO46_13 [Nocardioidaceae bacterium]|nr:hypothetical protein [Nocardioidaceae bacterium]